MRGGLALGAPAATGAFTGSRRMVADRDSGWRGEAPVWGVALLILVLIWRVPDIAHLPGFLQPLWGTLLIAVAATVAGRNGWHQREVWSHPIARGLIVLSLVMLIGAVFSMQRVGSFSFFLKRMMPNLALAWLAAAAVRGSREADLLARVTVVGAAMFSLVALAVGYAGVEGRWTGYAYYDPNDLALHLVATMPLAVYFLRPRMAGAAWSVIAGGSLLLFLLVLVKTESRGGLLGLVAVAGLLALTYDAIPARVRIGGMLAGVLALGALGSERFWARIQTILEPQSDYNLDVRNPSGRIEIWKRGLGYIAENPVLGVGLNAYLVAEARLPEIARQRRMAGRSLNYGHVAHNLFIHVGVELGLVGLAVFVWLLWKCWRTLAGARRVRRSAGADAADRSAALARVLAISLAGYLVCSMFLSAPYFPFLYLLLGLAVGLARSAGREPVEVPAPVPPRPARVPRGRGGLVRDAS